VVLLHAYHRMHGHASPPDVYQARTIAHRPINRPEFEAQPGGRRSREAAGWSSVMCYLDLGSISRFVKTPAVTSPVTACCRVAKLLRDLLARSDTVGRLRRCEFGTQATAADRLSDWTRHVRSPMTSTPTLGWAHVPLPCGKDKIVTSACRGLWNLARERHARGAAGRRSDPACSSPGPEL